MQADLDFGDRLGIGKVWDRQKIFRQSSIFFFDYGRVNIDVAYAVDLVEHSSIILVRAHYCRHGYVQSYFSILTE